MNIRYTPSQADTRAGLSYCWSEFPTFRLLVILVGALGGLVGLALSSSLVNALTLPVIFFTAAGTLILPWLLRRQLIAALRAR